MAEREIIARVLWIIFIVITRDVSVQSRGCNNTTQGPYKCKCPCEKTRTSKCYFLPGKDIKPHCVCREGHEGLYCNKCKNGWYQNGNFSDPKAYCIRCNCSRNLDTRSKITSCDPLTGKCLNCQRNTMGDQCELCAHGYHGDAVVAKNCTLFVATQQAGGNHINTEAIIIATCSAIGVVCIIAIIYLIYYRYRSRCAKGRIPKFWTVEISNRNYNDLDFSLLDSVSDMPFVYRNDTNEFEEALIADEGSKARLKIDMDSLTEDFEDTSF